MYEKELMAHDNIAFQERFPLPPICLYLIVFLFFFCYLCHGGLIFASSFRRYWPNAMSGKQLR